MNIPWGTSSPLRTPPAPPVGAGRRFGRREAAPDAACAAPPAALASISCAHNARGRVGRWTAAVLLGAAVAVAALGRPGPAAASGLDFACSATAPPPVVGVAPTLSGARVTFDGRDQAGATYRTDWDPALLFGATLADFLRIFVNTRDGSLEPPNLLRVDVPGTSPTPDLGFGAGVRLNTVGTSVRDLLRDDFGIPYDRNDPIVNPHGDQFMMAGVDFVFRRLSPDVTRYRAEYGVRLTFERREGSTRTYTNTLVRIGVDATDPAGRLPDEARFTVGFKQRHNPDPGNPDLGMFLVHQRLTYDDPAITATTQPPLRVSLSVTELDAAGDPVSGGASVDVGMVWDRTLPAFALGTKQACWNTTEVDSLGQVGLNHPAEPGGTPPAHLDLDVRSGAGAGVPLGTDPGDPRADQVRLHAVMAGVPARMDYLGRPEKITVTHSPEVTPTVVLDRFQLASEDGDPATVDAPTYLAALLRSVPVYAEVGARTDAGRALTGADIRFSTPACPAASGGDRLPDRNVPAWLQDCGRGAPAAPAEVIAILQNYLPEDAVSAVRMADMPGVPTDPYAPFLLYESRAALADTAPGPMNRPLLRVGGRAFGVESVAFDTAGGGPASTRIHAEARMAPAATGKVVFGVDGRDRSDELTNGGVFVSGTADLTPFPTAIARLDVSSDISRPLLVSYDFGAPVRVAGDVYAKLPGPGALEVNGRLAVGDDAGTGLPAHAQVLVQRTTDTDGSSRTGVYAWTPTPMRIRAGATLTDVADRALAYPYRTRVHADATVPANLSATVDQDAAGNLTYADARLCESGAPCHDRLALTAERGPQRPDDVDLLSPPPLPDIPDGADGRDPLMPPFTDPGGDEGVRAVMTPGAPGSPAVFGLRAVVADLERVTYRATPQEVCVRSRTSPGRRFVANVYSGLDTDGVLYADGTVTGLPGTLFARIDPASTGPDSAAPFLWLTTETCDLGVAPTGVAATEPLSSALPRVDAVVRYGAPDRLRAIGTPARVPFLAGRVDVDVLGSLGLHANLDTYLPRHVMVWQPGVTSCDDSLPPLLWALCEGGHQLYELDTWRRVRLKFRSSSRVLLTGGADAHVHLQSGGDYDVKAYMTEIPGSLDADVTLRQNIRLPWMDVAANVSASSGISYLRAELWDRRNPAYLGSRPAGVAPEPENRTPNYRAAVRNVPTTLRLTGRVRRSEAPNSTPRAENPLCARYAGRGNTDVAYVDADVDLGNRATDVSIGMRTKHGVEAREDVWGYPGFIHGLPGIAGRIRGPGIMDPRGDNEAILGDVSANAPLSGTVRAKVANLGFGIPGFEYTLVATLGISLCLDLDVPVVVDVSRVSRARLAISGPKLVLAVGDADYAAGGRVNARFEERLFRGGAWVTQPGVYSAYQRHRLSFEDPVSAAEEDFVLSRSTRDEYTPVYATDFGAGVPDSDPAFPYWYSNQETNRITFDRHGALGGVLTGYRTSQVLIDPVFSMSERDQLRWWDREAAGLWALIDAGVAAYSAVGGLFPGVTDADFLMPDLPTTPAAVRSTSGALDCLFGPAIPDAVGADGTRYRVRAHRAGLCLDQASVPVYLEARYPNGSLRWARFVSPEPVPLDSDRSRRRIEVSLSPDPDDGSLAVRVGDYRGQLDAGGNGMLTTSSTRWRLQDIQTVTVHRGDPVSLLPPPGACTGACFRYVYDFGDGTVSSSPSHHYRMPGSYYAHAVAYNTSGTAYYMRRYRIEVT